MTAPKAPVRLAVQTVRDILGLLGTAEAVLSVLKERGERGERQVQASLEEVVAHLAGGPDAAYLICQIGWACHELELLLPAKAGPGSGS